MNVLHYRKLSIESSSQRLAVVNKYRAVGTYLRQVLGYGDTKYFACSLHAACAMRLAEARMILCKVARHHVTECSSNENAIISGAIFLHNFFRRASATGAKCCLQYNCSVPELKTDLSDREYALCFFFAWLKLEIKSGVGFAGLLFLLKFYQFLNKHQKTFLG